MGAFMKTLLNNVQIPKVGYGTSGITKEKVEESILTALNVGYRLIDTATLYNNEELIGRALSKTDIPRSEIFVTSKVWEDNRTKEKVKASFFKSMEDLQVDTLDLYMVHWPKDMNPETWEAIEELYEQGYVKAIGVANFHIHHLQELFKTAKIKPMVNQVERHPFINQSELADFCAQHNIVMEAWSPIGKGKYEDNPILSRIARDHNKSVAQIILRWHYQTEFIAIPKSETPSRIKENFSIFDFELNKREIADINGLDKHQRMGRNPDII